jgi:hypothetical protein
MIVAPQGRRRGHHRNSAIADALGSPWRDQEAAEGFAAWQKSLSSQILHAPPILGRPLVLMSRSREYACLPKSERPS